MNHLNCHDYWLCLNQTKPYPIVVDWERGTREKMLRVWEKKWGLGDRVFWCLSQREWNDKYNEVKH